MRYRTETVACPECLGDGTLTYERPEPWVARDTPPSLEEYSRECWACHGTGEAEVDDFDGQPSSYEEYQDLYGGDDPMESTGIDEIDF